MVPRPGELDPALTGDSARQRQRENATSTRRKRLSRVVEEVNIDLVASLALPQSDTAFDARAALRDCARIPRTSGCTPHHRRRSLLILPLTSSLFLARDTCRRLANWLAVHDSHARGTHSPPAAVLAPHPTRLAPPPPLSWQTVTRPVDADHPLLIHQPPPLPSQSPNTLGDTLPAPAVLSRAAFRSTHERWGTNRRSTQGALARTAREQRRQERGDEKTVQGVLESERVRDGRGGLVCARRYQHLVEQGQGEGRCIRRGLGKQ